MELNFSVCRHLPHGTVDLGKVLAIENFCATLQTGPNPLRLGFTTPALYKFTTPREA
jgi:hypothetical protein